MPIDLTGPGNEALLAHEDHGIKGRYACVEQITELPDGRTEWRLVTSSTPAGFIPKALADKTLPARIALVRSDSDFFFLLLMSLLQDVTSFMDWYYTCYLKPKNTKTSASAGSGNFVVREWTWPGSFPPRLFHCNDR